LYHFKSQGDTSDFNREFKDKIEYNISSKENSLSINEVTDKPFTVTEILSPDLWRSIINDFL
jgi:hypothetical protein